MSAAELGQELGVSTRTIYRDIATLVGSGAPIEGAAGLGYVLRPGFFLPPLNLGEDELDAVILGLRWVSRRGDPSLARGASDALAKIKAVLPPSAEDRLSGSGLFAGGRGEPPHLPAIRAAMREERKLHLAYTGEGAPASERLVWPVALGFFDQAEVLAAWCELRNGFRHFRLDRITRASVSDQRCPKRRAVLLAAWRNLDQGRVRNCTDRN